MPNAPVFNAMIDHHPTLIARCTGVADVIVAVNFAREEGLVVAVRGGGHSVPATLCAKVGVVIDLTPMRDMGGSRTRAARAQQASRG
jgi:FAD/FMN-containing dehydrogenase